MSQTDNRMKFGYTLFGVAAASFGYVVFAELAKSENELQMQVFKFLAVFWPMFTLLSVYRLLWASKPGRKPASKPQSSPKKSGAAGDDDDDDEEPTGGARRRVRREK